jgi:hypothetical protein
MLNMLNILIIKLFNLIKSLKIIRLFKLNIKRIIILLLLIILLYIVLNFYFSTNIFVIFNEDSVENISNKNLRDYGEEIYPKLFLNKNIIKNMENKVIFSIGTHDKGIFNFTAGQLLSTISYASILGVS